MSIDLEQLRKASSPVLLSLFICLVVGCSNVSTTVSTYRNVDSLPVGASFRIVPEKMNDNDDNSVSSFDQLEFDFFAKKLSTKLEAMGLSEATTESSDLTVTLVYDVDRQKRSDSSRPLHFYTHFGDFYRFGSVVLIDDTDRDLYEFIRKVKVRIGRSVEGENPEQMVSLTAFSRGQCQFLPSVYDPMLDAIFANFYSASGSIVRVRSKNDRPCEGTI